MNLSPLAIALQGIGYSVTLQALQGFADAASALPQVFRRSRVKVVRKKRENDEALLLFVL